MKTSYIITAIILILLVAGVVYAFNQNKAQAPGSTIQTTQASPGTGTATSTPATAGTAAGVSVAAGASVTTAIPAPQHFAVNGNDTTADNLSIVVPKGTPVSITFGADAQGTYHGGLDFRSSVVNTGTIAPGNTKTVNFTAEQSFVFQPYWPATNIAKPYHITITVD